MISNKQPWVIAGLVAGLLGYGTYTTSVLADTVATAPVKGITARVSVDYVCQTLATELAPIPGTTTSFFQASPTPQEVVVTFTAEWSKPDPSEIPAGSQAAGAFIFLFIDGNRVDPVSSNGGVLVHEGTAIGPSNGTHGFTFVTEPIPRGQHTARMYWEDNVLGPFGQPNGTICVKDRSLVVQHDR